MSRLQVPAPRVVALFALLPSGLVYAQGAPNPPVIHPPRTPAVDSGTLPKTARSSLEPYGFVLGNLFYDRRGFNQIDVPTYAVGDTASAFSGTLRQTRLGLRAATDVAALASPRASGLLEVDFFGGLPNQGLGDTFPVPRLRLAHTALSWKYVQVVAGQDWSQLAMLSPVTLSHQAIVGLAGAGNLFSRLPQLRVQGKLPGPSGLEATWAAALVAPVDSESSAFSMTNVAGPGERSTSPGGEARLGVSLGRGEWKLAVAGSSHVHREHWILGDGNAVDLGVWAVAGEAMVQLGRWIRLQGEAFTGSNLGIFLGGVQQAVRKDMMGTVMMGVSNIDTRGAWAQVSLVGWAPLHLHVGAGIDDPRNSQVSNDGRLRNRALLASAIGHLTPKLHAALEWGMYATDQFEGRLPSRHHASQQLNFATQYEF